MLQLDRVEFATIVVAHFGCSYSMRVMAISVVYRAICLESSHSQQRKRLAGFSNATKVGPTDGLYQPNGRSQLICIQIVPGLRDLIVISLATVFLVQLQSIENGLKAG